MWHYLCDSTFSHFDTIPECDRHRLIDEVTGKELWQLASNGRLKRYNIDREQFNAHLPSLHMGPGAGMQRPHTSQMVVGQRQGGPEEPRPVEIISEKQVAGRNSTALSTQMVRCTIVTGLTAHYLTTIRPSSIHRRCKLGLTADNIMCTAVRPIKLNLCCGSFCCSRVFIYLAPFGQNLKKTAL